MLNPEHLLVPYEASALPTGPWLVFAPHADDESFGMGGSLLRAKAESLVTHVIVLTDGALGGDAPDLVGIRQQEVQQAAELMGVKTLACWSEQDRTLADSLAVSARLVEQIADAITAVAPATVFFPAPLELHPDHRAAAQLVWAALQMLARTGAPVPVACAYEISVQSPINLLLDITDQRAEKERLMAIYASQNGENNYQELVLALDKARTFTLPAQISHAEGFCRYPARALSQSLQQATADLLALYW
jgi:LmbE family N-acetylglucosaminyl deacetylase